MDIARTAGVTDATVSNVLNGKGRVSPAVRERVLQIAREMRYSSNVFARGLKTRRSNMIGVLTSALSSHVTTGQIAGVDNLAQRRGYGLLIACGNEHDPPRMEAFAGRGVDGVIWLPSGANLPAGLHDILHASGLPYTYSYRAPDDDPAASGAMVDQIAGGEIAARRLLSTGRTKLAFAAPASNRVVYRERLEGFANVVASAGLTLPCDYVLTGNSTLTEDINALAERIVNLRPLPEGIFACWDYVAMTVLRLCRNRGIRVPEDMAVIGFDDLRVCEMTEPPLTSIVMPLAECGRTAATKLIDFLECGETDSPEPGVDIYRPSLVERESV